MPFNAAKNYSNQSKPKVPHFPTVKIKDLIQFPARTSRRKTRNELLANLSAESFGRLEPFMQKISFGRGEAIYEVGSAINYIFFPDDLIASRLALMEDGSLIEVGMIGHEGMIGAHSLMGAEKTECLTLAENNGAATRVEAKILKQLFLQSPELQTTFLRFYDRFLTQVAQKAACRCRHTILKQLCCWLLHFQERSLTGELSLTQETIAQRLGARRSSVTVAVNELEAKKIIGCGRGNIEILDHSALIRETCECYANTHVEETIDLAVKYVH